MPFPLSTAEAGRLRETCTVLHLLHQRNRNQHRRSKWYKDLRIFRRQVLLLLPDVAEDVAERSAVKRRLENVARRARFERRLAWWSEGGAVERWYMYVENASRLTISRL